VLFLKQHFQLLKQSIMGNILYLIAVVLIILWAIGYFGYSAGSVIHILLVIALVSVLLNIIRSNK
jgi:type IV secretory pathway VirB2 component (pilin)